MASRFFSGSKPSSKTTKARTEPPAPGKPSALPTRSGSSIPSAPAKTSRIPTQPTTSSALPRSRTSKTATAGADKQSLKSAQAASSSSLAAKQAPVEQPIRRSTSLREQQRTTAAIPRGVQVGMGTRTEISSNPLPGRNRLRRKASSADQRSKYAQSEPSDTSYEAVSHHTTSDKTSPGGYTDPFPGSILGISMPVPNSSSSSAYPQRQTTPTEQATSNSRMASFASKQPHKISTTDLPPPTPNYATNARSSSSSTRYSESPGPFSRTSTPTSASSQSPGMLQTPKFAVIRQRPSTSPTRSRPPVTRRKFPGSDETGEQRGLSALRESQTSSSSSSTVKGVEVEQYENSRIAKRSQDNKTPPTPPLRLSSKRPKEPQPVGQPSASASITEDTARVSTEEPRTRLAPPSRLIRPSQIATSSNQTTSKLPAAGGLPRPKLTPSRPSREKVPPLHSGETAVIVKSNLPHLATTGHKRRESAEKNVIQSPQKSEEIPKKPERNLSSIPSSKRASITSPHLLSATNKKEGPVLRADTSVKTPKSETTTPSSASPSKSSSRFGLFSRRIKSPSETSISSPPEKPEKLVKREKLVKKGPVAGTGHEGYGKYARRGRSGSTSTAASRGRSSSNDRHSQSFGRPSSSRKSSFGSNTEKPELDDFYKERLEPVVIGGGGEIRENRNSQSSLYQTPSGQTSQASVDTGSYYTTRSRVTQDTSAGTSSVESSQRVSRELLPAPILTTAPGKLPEGRTLAHRRSLLRSQMFGEGETMKIPPPINTKVLAPSPLLDTYDSTLSSAPRTDASIDTHDVSEGHEGNWLRSGKKKSNGKGKLVKKWNFFRPLTSRSPERSARPSNELQRYQSNESGFNTDVTPLREPRAVAHYALMDDVEPEGEDVDLDVRLRDIEGNLDLEHDPDSKILRAERDRRAENERQMSMLLPSPPKFPTHFDNSHRPISPKVLLNQSPPKDTSPPKSTQQVQSEPEDKPNQYSLGLPPVRRPSRLQQVGRIPRVVSKRDRLYNPSAGSFSRPFHRATPSNEEASGSQSESQPESRPRHQPQSQSGSRSAVERPTLALQTNLPPSDRRNPFSKPASAPPANNALYGMSEDEEFLRFSPQKGSDTSTSTGSSGILSLVPVTAVTPGPQTALEEDDVWNEYDQLLDDVGNGLPSLDSPEIENMIASFPSLSNLRSPPPPSKRDSPLMASDGSSDTARAQSPAAIKTPSLLPYTGSFLPPPPPSVNTDISPVSLSDVYANYGESSSTPAKSNQRHSVTSIESGSNYSSQTTVSRPASHASVDSARTKRVTQVMAEKTQSSSSHTLRFSALMTSRWLSFDRVLFSPAQEEVLQNKQNRVLVLDGLQNDDWSAYCALTYPETTIYNLASFSKHRQSADTSNAPTWNPPPNLRRVSHGSIAAPFPFPKGFFTAVVFRFPAASTPQAYRNAISECKRVLRPGGYLELTALDMDFVNAGTLARRAVRQVKESIAHSAPDVSLSPASDALMKYIGRRGFENVNKCIVGVPVAGAVTGAALSAPQTAGGSGGGPSNPPGAASQSLGRMLAGKQSVRGSGMSEVSGPKMVARVGRWWWTRCYEKGVLGEQVQSMWADRALIKECEKRETGMRLVVCYAQKPESPRRRTVSV